MSVRVSLEEHPQSVIEGNRINYRVRASGAVGVVRPGDRVVNYRGCAYVGTGVVLRWEDDVMVFRPVVEDWPEE